ncbi:polygalacturonase QRT2-like [Ziziphus jujuba]|uniref:Polygalacturonase QRT2-like n=1 Tax=Ziziphus jujuba TaxID=326968 RepID=A0A6P4A102_ZIZJJ|nr:polygalacturonase QRT2-like [Ziziphus jujuba]
MKNHRKFPDTCYVAIPAEVLQATLPSKSRALPSTKYLKIVLVLAILVIFLAFSSLSFSCEKEALEIANNAITIPVLSYDPNIIGGYNTVSIHRNEMKVVHESLLKFQSHITNLYKIISWWFSSAKRIPSTKTSTLNVHDFGAKGDGITDDSEAFKEAWNRACSSEGQRVVLLIPRSNYMLKPMKFSGPCKSDHLIMKMKGTIKASQNRTDYKNKAYWIVFQKLQNFRVEGGGLFDGNGRIWWQDSCKLNKSLPCTGAPNAVNFIRCNNLKVDNLRFRNAQKMHLVFEKCVNVKVLNLKISAPEDSPNTDGIHVTRTQNLKIANCVIKTGDDCISIVGASKNIGATDITCGPGHGISIGSLGARNSVDYVSYVVVNKATFSGTTNGVRIKTWQGGSGYAKNIRFQNITMQNVRNPIIIDQHYCDQREPCLEQDSAVQISNVVYSSIKGTSTSEVALRFDCSNSFPCQGIFLQDVDLQPHERVHDPHKRVVASCNNVMLTKTIRISPNCS